jgi:GTP-binding protein Era
MTQESSFIGQKSSFIGICGAPNAGKSSLVNHIVGSKVSIVSPRPQTTRVNVRGIVVKEQTQLIFVDTPGIMNPHDERQKKMVKSAWDGVTDVGQIVFVLDAKRGLTELSHKIIEGLKGKIAKSDGNIKAVAAINKIDIAEQEAKLQLAQALYDTTVFAEIFMTSVTKNKGIDDLVAYLVKNAGDAPWPYPEDQLSDANERFMAAEMTREKIFHLLREELPYSIDVETDDYKDGGPKGITIHQTIYTNREAHKKIIIGDKGAMIKKIGESSRRELGEMLDNKVHLFLHVKVTKEKTNAVE